MPAPWSMTSPALPIASHSALQPHLRPQWSQTRMPWLPQPAARPGAGVPRLKLPPRRRRRCGPLRCQALSGGQQRGQQRSHHLLHLARAACRAHDLHPVFQQLAGGHAGIPAALAVTLLNLSLQRRHVGVRRGARSARDHPGQRVRRVLVVALRGVARDRLARESQPVARVQAQRGRVPVQRSPCIRLGAGGGRHQAGSCQVLGGKRQTLVQPVTSEHACCLLRFEHSHTPGERGGCLGPISRLQSTHARVIKCVRGRSIAQRGSQ
mmetsp:Transcript_33120/g.84075  ORF Transcript_33120/g.84075 Transcript_33120/m.84075 type:complete len:266 (+) Transcript_33120:1105-1902(+)